MSSSKALGLQASIVTSYDQTKTTFQGGRIGQKSITDGNGAKTTIGIQPVISMDVEDDTTTPPVGLHTSTANGRIFIGKGLATNVWTVSYYLLSTVAGVSTSVWQGDLKFTFGAAAATYTITGFMVDDSNPASMIFTWCATHTTTTDGGLFACWGVNVTDFVKVSVQTLPVATLANQTKTVYQMGDNASQASQTMTQARGVGYDSSTKNAYVLHGSGASPNPIIFKFNLTSPPGSSPAANGYDSTLFTLKTGSITPTLAGTVLAVNSVQVITPTNQPSPNNANNGSLCLSFLSSTTGYFVKISDITNGATTLPSLSSFSMAATSDFLTPATILLGQYIASIDKWCMLTVNGPFLLKQGVNNDPNAKIFGFPTYVKTEIGGTIQPDFGGATALCLTDGNGWAILTNTLTGQRGALAMDIQSDESSINQATGQIYSSIISPVLPVKISVGIYMAIYKEFAKRSVYPTVQYRTANFSTGPGTGFDATWTTAPKDGDLSAIANVSQVQFRFIFTTAGLNNTNASQINEAYLVYTDQNEVSPNWEASVDNSTQSGVSPTRTAFRLQTAYASGTVPKEFFRAYDDSGNLIVVADTVTNASSFEYTTNNGTSWNALGTIPNTALTTELRYNWSSPPGVAVTCSLRET